ncbi:threonine-phosphate decarboxylase CobD [Vibrio sp. SCSIO 43136]|uniref:threonine-phosphate decarboxylase CobD n=1 Tax=Vibrio sp. SCSIO 43136 TaxID=2819101 RepID=UPI0020762FC2|nr:threonine-phosphate decarboxylase CobD [Vibrio sp. SCSIO 43136]USD66870.1 threonine-phosphate decarboxylase [Vibrio sp. SCSIO 43136]
MLNHGGKLLEFANRYQIPAGDWLDLSTGVSPITYPVPEIPETVWNRLPEDDDGLELAAANYYCSDQLLPIAGSQAAIQALPELIATEHESLHVLLPSVGYKEHQHAWQMCKNTHCEFYQVEPSAEQLATADVVLVINPNNPSTHKIDARELEHWRKSLKPDALLVVDEAFMDMTPQASLLKLHGNNIPDNLIVLRSLGKFFGLAGLRVGFMFASLRWREALKTILGPWAVSGPARYVAKHALKNKSWQDSNRRTLIGLSERMGDLLSQYFPHSEVTGQALFWRVGSVQAKELHHGLAQQGVLVRLTDEQDALRFGLPQSEAHWQQLEQALQNLGERQ